MFFKIGKECGKCTELPLNHPVNYIVIEQKEENKKKIVFESTFEGITHGSPN